MMTKLFLFICLSLSPVSQSASDSSETDPSPSEILFRDLGLEGKVSFDAFIMAVDGFYDIEGRRKEVLTFIDFTKPSAEPRLWVIDMVNHKVLFNTHVAHGRNSGENYATSFSNSSGSYRSSLGFYLTGETYFGKNGYSMMLDGLEAGVNDNARTRAVVVHGASYANPSVISSSGRLGRSPGCPALPEEYAAPVIDAIKERSVLYIYGQSS